MTGSKPMISFSKRTALLLAALFSLMLGGFAALPAIGQEVSPEQLALARKYIDLTDQSGLYEATIVKVGLETYQTLLPQNPEIDKPLNDAITKTIESYKPRKGELFDQFARLYALAFTQEELQAMVTFYESPVGVKVSKLGSKLNTGMSRILSVFEVNLRTEFFAQVRATLKAAGIDS